MSCEEEQGWSLGYLRFMLLWVLYRVIPMALCPLVTSCTVKGCATSLGSWGCSQDRSQPCICSQGYPGTQGPSPEQRSSPRAGIHPFSACMSCRE